jgi:predicted choloylglycine hydrolase
MPFRWVREDQPGGRWRSLFERSWPSYRAWFLKEGATRRPALAACRLRLEEHMPEMVGMWEHLVGLTGDDPDAARMLSLYRPTPYLAGCSQAIWSRGEPLLVRNYDYHPSAFEGTILLSRWNGTRVLAASDCLWGALDGMNEHGLVLALAFGGRRAVGDGFGIPLILRYALETCRTCAEAVAVLRRVPSHMAYNVSVLDAAGNHAVVGVSPDREPIVTEASVATNHQEGGGWSAYAERTRSSEREDFLRDSLPDPSLDAESFAQLFLQPPLFATNYEQSFGTLYTAVYAPRRGRVSFLWPDARVDQGFDDFREQTVVIPLMSPSSPGVG